MSYHRGKDTMYHIGLGLILLFGIVGTYYVAGNKQIQAGVVFLTILVYIAFALHHQYHMHRLSSKIVIEYVTVGAFGMMLMVFLLKGFGL